MRLFLFVVLLFSSLALAANRTKDALKTEMKGSEWLATLKEGYHFNEKAPNALIMDDKNLKPVRLQGREAAFAIPAEFGIARAALYICDDAVTFCETQFVELKGKGGIGKKNLKAKASKGYGQINKFGFIEDDFGKALAEAKKKNKLVLVDFSARWCPSCIRLEREMFGTKEFKKITKDLVKVKIDADRFENMVLAEKYSVKGIPTMLVINSNQEEIDRVIDYQPIEVLQSFFAGIVADSTSLKELTEKAKAGDNVVALRLGKRLYAAGRAEESLNYLGKVQPPPVELAAAQVKAALARAAADKNEKKQLEKILRQSLKNEPGSIRSIGWRTHLVSNIDDASEKKMFRDEGVALADKLLADPAGLKEAMKTEDVGEFTGYEPLMLAGARAELVEAAGSTPEELQAAWNKASEIGLAMSIPAKKVGTNIRLLSMLLQAKRFEDANRLTNQLMKVEPKNAELQRRRLRVLVEMKKYNEAIVLGRKVVKNSYGRNEFWAAELLAQAYVNANRMREAEVFINEYLSRNEIDWPNMKNSRKAFEELKQKIPKA